MDMKIKVTEANGAWYVEVERDGEHVGCQWFERERDAAKAEDLLKRTLRAIGLEE